MLHIPVLFSIGPPLKLAPGQARTQIMDRVFTGNPVISGPQRPRPNTSAVLNADSLSWLCALQLSMLAGGQRAASAGAVCGGHFGNQGPGGKALCLCWLGVQFNRRDLFQTISSTILKDTQGEPKRGTTDQRGSSDFPPVWRSHETHPDVLIWLWIGEDK